MNDEIKKEVPAKETSVAMVPENTEIVKKLSDKQVENLRKPLPTEAVSQHPTKAYLSTIKAPYVIERFNDVFGTGRWFLQDETVNTEGKMIVLKVWFSVPEYGINLWSYGGNDNSDLGDAYKGAVTDALTKIGSYLGVGMDVFKGLGDKPNKPPAPSKSEGTLSQKKLIKDLMTKKGFTVESLAKDGIIAGKTPPGEVIDYLFKAKVNFEEIDLSSPEVPL